jgi:hypothetical protein
MISRPPHDAHVLTLAAALTPSSRNARVDYEFVRANRPLRLVGGGVRPGPRRQVAG